MNTVLNFNIPLSINELGVLLKEQLSFSDRQYLAKILQDNNQEEEEETSKEEILANLKEDLIALKNGTLKTRPFAEFLAELETEGYL